MSWPSYLKLIEDGRLLKRVRSLQANLASCTLCPHGCRADRRGGETGFCGAGKEVEVASYGPHFGEERVLTGQGGSGTIFFHYCTMRCLFCQNADISQQGGKRISTRELAAIMLELENRGCLNLNLVTPTHYLPQILDALCMATELGFSLPLVYNCGGYERVETLKILEGIVDLYLPDFKYADRDTAWRLSGIRDYPLQARTALREMHRQVGDLTCEPTGTARRGVLVRHLLLPGGLSGTREIVSFLAKELSAKTFLNLMDQYRPVYQAYKHPPLNRPVSRQEYRSALRLVQTIGPRLRLDQDR